MELARRIQSPEEAAMVVEVAQTFAQHRARRQQHDGISPALSTYLLKVGNQVISQLIKTGTFVPRPFLMSALHAYMSAVTQGIWQGNLNP
jgi:hypothetical protein